MIEASGITIEGISRVIGGVVAVPLWLPTFGQSSRTVAFIVDSPARQDFALVGYCRWGGSPTLCPAEVRSQTSRPLRRGIADRSERHGLTGER